MSATQRIVKATVNPPTEEFRSFLNRALNTLEPVFWPEWARSLMYDEDSHGLMTLGGIQPSDEITITVRRKVEEAAHEPPAQDDEEQGASPVPGEANA